jgi:hypothetical protein
VAVSRSTWVKPTGFQPFGCWYGVLHYLRSGGFIYYLPALDERPYILPVLKEFKCGKLRVEGPPGVGRFTIGPLDIERLFYVAEEAP